jgi:hypothetical protein
MADEHTPGPWTFLERYDPEGDHNAEKPFTICGPANDDLANVYSREDSSVSISRQEAFANARLMSAAPDMLTALKAHVKADRVTGLPGRAEDGYKLRAEAMRLTRVAIAKAEGTK